MIALSPRNRLAQRSQALHLSLREFCKAFRDAGMEIGESVEVSDRQAKRWLSGTAQLPRPAARRVLEHWLGEPVATLFGPPAATEPIILQTAAEAFAAAAREAGEHAIASAQSLDAGALEQLHAEARRAAGAYFTTPPLTQFVGLLRLRALVRDQLDRTRKPRQEAELYLILGQVCGLLASISTALGHLEPAEEHARAAFTYGRIIDHPSLCAWARALQVAATFWSGRPRHAAEIATVALDTAPRGTACARLHAVRARALALIGARDEVRAAIHAAGDDLDIAGADALLDGIGGELGFSRARTELCASTAFVALGDARAAEQAANVALGLFMQTPAGERWVAGEIGARIDLGTARALRGDLAGAEVALSPVFALAAERRTDALSQRLAGLGRVLTSRQYRGSTEANRLGEAIEDFTMHAIGRTARASLMPGG